MPSLLFELEHKGLVVADQQSAIPVDGPRKRLGCANRYCYRFLPFLKHDPFVEVGCYVNRLPAMDGRHGLAVAWKSDPPFPCISPRLGWTWRRRGLFDQRRRSAAVEDLFRACRPRLMRPGRQSYDSAINLPEPCIGVTNWGLQTTCFNPEKGPPAPSPGPAANRQSRDRWPLRKQVDLPSCPGSLSPRTLTTNRPTSESAIASLVGPESPTKRAFVLHLARRRCWPCAVVQQDFA